MMRPPVFLDHHATTPVLPQVAAAMQPYWEQVLPRHKADDVFEAAKEQLAPLIGAPPRSLTFTSGATEANNLALTGVALAAPDNQRREILVSAIEHDSILRQDGALKRNGFHVRYIPVTASGYIDPAAVQRMVSDQTLLVSVMWANHEIGTLQPVTDIAKIVKSTGALMHTDATQAVGKVPVNVAAADVDMLSFSAHKMGGPQGVGALYVRQAPPVPLARLMQGGAQQALRAGTIPLPLVVGFATSATHMHENMTAMNAHRAGCAGVFLEILQARGIDFDINGSVQNRLAGSLNLRFAGVSADDLLLHFANDMIFSSGAACRNGAPSSVLAAIGLSPDDISRSLRLCFGHGNTLPQAQDAAQKIADFIQENL